MAFVDKEINCKDCGGAFVFTAGEQEFYEGSAELPPLSALHSLSHGQRPGARRGYVK